MIPLLFKFYLGVFFHFKKIEIIRYSINFQGIRHINFEQYFEKNTLIMQTYFKTHALSYSRFYNSVNFANFSIKFETFILRTSYF